MNLKICHTCKRPFLTSQEVCPKCPPPYTWNQESWANVGCLTAMTLLPFGIVFLLLFFFFVAVFSR